MAGKSYRVVVVSTLKGGVRKTTSVMMIAFELASRGEDVTVFDADSGTQGVTDWATVFYDEHPDGELPFHVYQWSNQSGLLVPFIRTVMAKTGSTWALVDVGGEAPEVLKQLARHADEVISPFGPEDAEHRRLPATRSVLRENGDPRMRVLLTRVPQVGAGISRGVREMLTGQPDPFEVLDVEIPQNREVYAHPWGSIPKSTGNYADLVDVLLNGNV